MRKISTTNNLTGFGSAQNRNINRTTESSSSKWLFAVAASLTFSLLAGAVYSTASVARLSYLSAQFQTDELQLQQRKQQLEENLAQAQALELPVAYAKQEGFSKQSSSNLAVLDLSPDLASNISTR